MAETGFEVQSLARSCNEVLLLAVLLGGSKHGYQIALELEERSGGFFRFNHGTLYPILHKLEKDGLIRGEWGESGPRRKKKSYKLTPAGRRSLQGQLKDWQKFFEQFSSIVGELRP
jgi:DNA-binding PadR family transcriptional regulator